MKNMIFRDIFAKNLDFFYQKLEFLVIFVDQRHDFCDIFDQKFDFFLVFLLKK